MNVRRRICGLAVLLSLLAAVGGAQDKKREAQLRTVRGVVADKSDSPLSGSVVFLKNVRTNSVRSSYTDDNGNYRFSGLDPNADYELHAEKRRRQIPHPHGLQLRQSQGHRSESQNREEKELTLVFRPPAS